MMFQKQESLVAASAQRRLSGLSAGAWWAVFIGLTFGVPVAFFVGWFWTVDHRAGLGPIATVHNIPFLKSLPLTALVGILVTAVIFLVRPYELALGLLSRSRRQWIDAYSPYTQRRRLALYDGYSFALPWVFGMLVLTLYPMVFSLIMSFFKWDVLSTPEFLGLDNYRRMFFDDELYRTTLKNSLFYAVVQVPVFIVGSLSVALLMNQRVRGIRFYRTLFYLPAVLAGPAVLLLFLYIFDPNLGVINAVLRQVFHLGQAPLWFQHELSSKPTFIIISLFGVGTSMIIYLAALHAVPGHLYEASEIDGASRWAKFWNVTLPMITPAIFFNIILGIIGAFQIFDEAFVVTRGGPLNSTFFYAYYIYWMAFQNYRMGYASALAWVLLVIVLVLTLIQFRLAGRWVYYEGEQD